MNFSILLSFTLLSFYCFLLVRVVDATCCEFCDTCDAGSICPSDQRCTTCTENRLLYILSGESSGSCLDDCPSTTYPFSQFTGGRCNSCKSDCYSCTGANDCATCQNYKSLLNDACYDTCPMYYFSTTGSAGLGKECHACANNCQSCNSATECTKCDEKKSDGSYYFTDEPIDGQCIMCKGNCSKCTTATDCKVCYNNTVLYDDACVEECPSKLYHVAKGDVTYSSYGKECKRCQDNCDYCTTFENCSICEIGYGIELSNKNNQSCKNCIVNNCLACYSNYQDCNVCKDGYVKQLNGNCEPSCPLREYEVGYISVNNFTGIKCKYCGKFCKQCANNETCNICTDSAYWHYGKCIYDCPDGYYPIPSVNIDGRECRPAIHTAIAALFIASLVFFIIAMIFLHLKKVCAYIRWCKQKIRPNKVKDDEEEEIEVDDDPEDEDLMQDLEEQLRAKKLSEMKSEALELIGVKGAKAGPKQKGNGGKINAKVMPTKTK